MKFTLAAPILYVLAGMCIGWVIPAWGRHKAFGLVMLVIAGVLLFFAAEHSSLVVSPIHVQHGK